MKKLLLTSVFLLAVFVAFTQTKPKQTSTEKQPSQAEMEKMMEDAMKSQGLSPEEQEEMKKNMGDAMKTAEFMKSNGITGNASATDGTKIPAKQVKLLSKIPVIASQPQYNTYISTLLAECKKNTKPSVIAEADKLITQSAGDPGALMNMAPQLFLQKNPEAAVYTAIKSAIGNPNKALVQDNLAVILHQTGYPEKAIPILKFLLVTNNNPLVLNNLGQSYLSLGDTANARKYFMGCLKKDTDFCEANCGMGLLIAESGKIAEATPYIIRSLKTAYTETAEQLIKKNKVKLKLEDIKPKVPDYFNPQKYKPVPAAYSMEMVEKTIELRQGLEETARMWYEKFQKVSDEQTAQIEKETMGQLAARGGGFLSNNPFSKKAKLMIRLINEDSYVLIIAEEKNKYLAREKSLNVEMEQKLTDMYGHGRQYDNDAQQCARKVEILNDYLSLSAKNQEAYERQTLPKLYDYTNQSLYWYHFLFNEEQYNYYYHYFIKDFFEALHDYDQVQPLYPTPAYIAKHCKNYKEELEKIKKVKDSTDKIEKECPVNIKFKFKVASFKANCEGYEIEGGKVIALGYEEDWETGEFAFAFGLGIDGDFEIFSGGAKGQMVCRFDKDFSPIDMAMKFEGGGEATVGVFNVEEKVTAILAISGVHLNAIHMGQKHPIFNRDVKDF